MIESASMLYISDYAIGEYALGAIAIGAKAHSEPPEPASIVVDEAMLSEIEDRIDDPDDSEELISDYVDQMPMLIAEIRRCWRLLDENGVER